MASSSGSANVAAARQELRRLNQEVLNNTACAEAEATVAAGEGLGARAPGRGRRAALH